MRRSRHTSGIKGAAQPGQRPRRPLPSVSEGQQDGQRGWRRGLSGQGAVVGPRGAIGKSGIHVSSSGPCDCSATRMQQA